MIRLYDLYGDNLLHLPGMVRVVRLIEVIRTNARIDKTFFAALAGHVSHFLPSAAKWSQHSDVAVLFLIFFTHHFAVVGNRIVCENKIFYYLKIKPKKIN